MPFGEFPMALGVLYVDPRHSFEQAVIEQTAKLTAGKTADLQRLVSKGETWTVSGRAQTDAAEAGSAGSGPEL